MNDDETHEDRDYYKCGYCEDFTSEHYEVEWLYNDIAERDWDEALEDFLKNENIDLNGSVCLDCASYLKREYIAFLRSQKRGKGLKLIIGGEG